jgi:hypothetical protein
MPLRGLAFKIKITAVSKHQKQKGAKKNKILYRYTYVHMYVLHSSRTAQDNALSSQSGSFASFHP